MKTAIILLTVFCASIQAGWIPADDEEVQSTLDYCREEFQDLLEVQLFPINTPWIEKVPPCRVHCVVEHLDIWIDNHGYNATRVVDQLFQDGDKIAFAASVNKCINENWGQSECMAAFVGFKCFVQNNLIKKYEHLLKESKTYTEEENIIA